MEEADDCADEDGPAPGLVGSVLLGSRGRRQLCLPLRTLPRAVPVLDYTPAYVTLNTDMCLIRMTAYFTIHRYHITLW